AGDHARGVGEPSVAGKADGTAGFAGKRAALTGRCPASGGDEAAVEGKAGQAGNGADAGLLHEAFAMGFHGAWADAELGGDLLVGAAPGYAGQHVTLPRREPASGSLGRNRLREVGFSVPDRPDGIPQLGGGRVL